MAIFLSLFLIFSMVTYSSKLLGFVAMLNMVLYFSTSPNIYCVSSICCIFWSEIPILISMSLFLLCHWTDAAICVCKDGDEQALQKVIDYACGSGADCSQIEQNGPCFQPNTVKNHCDVAVNSFYQKKASTGATCDFNGAAVVSTSPPSSILFRPIYQNVEVSFIKYKSYYVDFVFSLLCSCRCF